MTELKPIRILAHGPTTENTRRYHLSIPFPDDQPDFPDGERGSWSSILRQLSRNPPFRRLANVLATVLSEPDVLAGSVRHYNFAVTIKQRRRPGQMRARWAEIDALVVKGASEGLEAIFDLHRNLMFTRDQRQPAREVSFAEYPHPSAIQPSPHQQLRVALPSGFNRMFLSIDRGLDPWGSIGLRDAWRIRPELLMVLHLLSGIQGISCLRLGTTELVCYIGLAYELEPIENQIRDIVERQLTTNLVHSG